MNKRKINKQNRPSYIEYWIAKNPDMPLDDCENLRKNYIKEHSYIFSSTELLSIAYRFAPTYNERLRLLQLLADYAPDVSEFAAQCIRFQNDCLEQFCQHGDKEVYELRIKDDPDAYE